MISAIITRPRPRKRKGVAWNGNLEWEPGQMRESEELLRAEKSKPRQGRIIHLLAVGYGDPVVC